MVSRGYFVGPPYRRPGHSRPFTPPWRTGLTPNVADEQFLNLLREAQDSLEGVKDTKIAAALERVIGRPPGPYGVLEGFTPAQRMKLDPAVPIAYLNAIEELRDQYPVTARGLQYLQNAPQPQVGTRYGTYKEWATTPDMWTLGVPSDYSAADLRRRALTSQLAGNFVMGGPDPLRTVGHHEFGHAVDYRLRDFINRQSGRTGTELQRLFDRYNRDFLEHVMPDFDPVTGERRLSGYSTAEARQTLGKAFEMSLMPEEREMMNKLAFGKSLSSRDLYTVEPSIKWAAAREPTAELFALKHALPEYQTGSVPLRTFMDRRDEIENLAKRQGFRGASTLGTMAGVAAPALVALIANKNKEAGKVAAGAATGAGLGSIFGGRGALVGAGLGALGSQLF